MRFLLIMIPIVFQFLYSGCDRDDPVSPVESTVKDIDGNIYSIVQIGEQWWMAENLKVSRYRNGDDIPQATEDAAWAQHLNTGAWTYYDNDPTYNAAYGKLYNWFAVNDSRGLCPEGWHVPSNEEWTMLKNYLGENSGGKLKSTTGWDNPNRGATNETGFTGLPGGRRSADHGKSELMGNSGYWWSSTEWDGVTAWLQLLIHHDTDLLHVYGNKRYGFSIRCVKD